MAREVYEVEDGHIASVGDHTLAKHRLLELYFMAYVKTLCASTVREQLRLTLIDAFAGAGEYETERGTRHLGSPAIALNAFEAALAAEAARRQKPFDHKMQFVFIEKREAAARALRELLKNEYPDTPTREVHVEQGYFERHIDQIIAATKAWSPRSHRGIILLDQYGWNQVPLPLVRRIFNECDWAEVILFFNVGRLLNRTANDDGFRSALRRFDPTINFEHWVRTREEAGEDFRPHLQALLHEHFKAHTGATHYTPFYIRSAKSNLMYWVIHLSKHVRARDVMNQQHVLLSNQEGMGAIGYVDEGLDMHRGYDARAPGALTLQRLVDFRSHWEARSRGVIAEQLRVKGLVPHQPVTAGALFSGLANGSSATADQFYGALELLVGQREAVIVNEEGKETSAERVSEQTLMMSPRQRLLFPVR